MNTVYFLKANAKSSSKTKAIPLFIPISSISYLEYLDAERYFIFFKEGVKVSGVDAGSMITIEPETRKTLGLPD